MNKTKILVTFLFLSYNIIFCQDNPDSLFHKGGELFQNNDFKGAIECFKKVSLNFEYFEYYNQSVYNLAYTYHQADLIDSAIAWYNIILNSDVKDDDKVGGRGIFEPFSNYKHFSAFNMGTIQFKRKNYKEALNYYNKSTYDYPYRNSSGTDLQISKNRLAIYRVDCLVNLQQYDSALSILIPILIESPGSGGYSELANCAKILINTHLNKALIRMDFENIFKSIKKERNNRFFEIYWKSNKYIIYPYFMSNDNTTVEELITDFKKSDFWKYLIN